MPKLENCRDMPLACFMDKDSREESNPENALIHRKAMSLRFAVINFDMILIFLVFEIVKFVANDRGEVCKLYSQRLNYSFK